MTLAAKARMGLDPAVNAPESTIPADSTSGTGEQGLTHMPPGDGRPSEGVNACAVCLKPLPPGAGQKFCSCRCRQMRWWAGEMAKALHDGRAEGLRAWLVELGRMARERGMNENE
jgi:hypothetical protein